MNFYEEIKKLKQEPQKQESLKPVLDRHDWSGRRFGKLVLVKKIGVRYVSEREVSLYQCLCDCGNESKKDRQYLARSKAPMCESCFKPPGRPRKNRV